MMLYSILPSIGLILQGKREIQRANDIRSFFDTYFLNTFLGLSLLNIIF